jgi:hypothetical protein
MKKIAVLPVICALLFFGCKKNHDAPAHPDVKTIRFWIINVAGEDMRFFSSLMNDSVTLKTNEKTKVYGSDTAFHEIYWVRQALVDTNYAVLTVNKPTELTCLLIDRNHIYLHYSDCFTPPAGKTLLRFIDFRGHNELKISNNAGDSAIIKAPDFDFRVKGYHDECLFIKPGNYSLECFAIKSNYEFKQDRVYLVFAGHDNKVHVLER